MAGRLVGSLCCSLIDLLDGFWHDEGQVNSSFELRCEALLDRCDGSLGSYIAEHFYDVFLDHPIAVDQQRDENVFVLAGKLLKLANNVDAEMELPESLKDNLLGLVRCQPDQRCDTHPPATLFRVRAAGELNKSLNLLSISQIGERDDCSFSSTGILDIDVFEYYLNRSLSICLGDLFSIRCSEPANTIMLPGDI